MTLSTEKELEIAVIFAEGVDLVRVRGSLIMSESQKLRDGIQNLLTKTQGRIVLDMSECIYMDSAGLGVLAMLAATCRKKEVDLRIAGLNPSMTKLFRFTRLDRMVPVFANANEAMK